MKQYDFDEPDELIVSILHDTTATINGKAYNFDSTEERLIYYR